MGKRGLRGLTALVGSLVIAWVGVGVGIGEAPAPGDDEFLNVARFARIDPALFESARQRPAFVPAALSSAQISVVLELADAPVAVQDAKAQQRGQKLSAEEKHAIRQQLEAKQNQLHDRLAAAGAQVVGQMQDAYNGVQVVVEQGNLTQLANLPGLVGIHTVQTFDLDNTNGVPFVGAPQAWQDTGVTGAGVKVGIIDTGIDYTHADFGGPGTVAAFAAAKATSTTAANPSLFGPSAPKVKGGYDFPIPTRTLSTASATGLIRQVPLRVLVCSPAGRRSRARTTHRRLHPIRGTSARASRRRPTSSSTACSVAPAPAMSLRWRSTELCSTASM